MSTPGFCAATLAALAIISLSAAAPASAATDPGPIPSRSAAATHRPQAEPCSWVNWVGKPVRHGQRVAVYVEWRQVDPCRNIKLRVRLYQAGRPTWQQIGDYIATTAANRTGTYARTVTWACPRRGGSYAAQANIVGDDRNKTTSSTTAAPC